MAGCKLCTGGGFCNKQDVRFFRKQELVNGVAAAVLARDAQDGALKLFDHAAQLANGGHTVAAQLVLIVAHGCTDRFAGADGRVVGDRNKGILLDESDVVLEGHKVGRL